MTDDGWTPVLPLDELPERRPRSVRAGEVDVLLYRIGDQILAIGNRCTHQGAPLNKGAIKELGSQVMVTCAAHGSVFRLTDGSVARGPATLPVPACDVRIAEGTIELRSRT
jgi:nitrite reductase/ring-hydroxylating ferredoxin subunit